MASGRKCNRAGFIRDQGVSNAGPICRRMAGRKVGHYSVNRPSAATVPAVLDAA